MRQFVFPRLVFWFYFFLSLTWRKKIIEPPEMTSAFQNGEPIILAHWHGDELAILHLVKRYKLCTMTSTSQDGQLIRHVIEKFGGSCSLGSSTRGGISALKGLVRLLRQGRVASMAVDGPKGPIHQVKPGVFELAYLASAPIFPLGVASRPAFVFKKSWNRAALPLPFARVIMEFQTPILLAADEDPKNFELKTKLEKALSDARSHAVNSLRGPDPGASL